MSWIWEDAVSALNALGETVSNIPNDIGSFIVNMFIALTYPFSLGLYFLDNIYTLLYNFFAPIINLVVIIGNIPIYLLQAIFVLPPPWTTVLYMSILLSMSVRIYRWLRTIPIIGKYIFGTGDN